MRAIVGALVGLVAFAGASLALAPNTPLSAFPSEAEAQQHCPTDTIVWLTIPPGVYPYKGERWYGNTIPGAFVCSNEPAQADVRALSQQPALSFAVSGLL